ncbi:MAG: hypothetical protein QGF59_09075, partial [Pirellulaceae bacterium]|nr:hypothetical protein [Pirellulaceae bacterium]
FHDDLTVYSDFTYLSKGPRHVPRLTREGKLSSSQQAMLKQILSTYGKVKWDRKSGPKVRDGMDESITLNGTGKKNKLDPKDLEFGTLSRLANTVITTARQKKPKPVIKQIGGLPVKPKPQKK